MMAPFPSLPHSDTSSASRDIEDGGSEARPLPPKRSLPFGRGGGVLLHCPGPSSRMPLQRCASRSSGTAWPRWRCTLPATRGQPVSFFSLLPLCLDSELFWG
jgi:hypothetical protein